MGNLRRTPFDPKAVLRKAHRCAARDDPVQAFDLYQKVIRHFLDQGNTLKALAAGKMAKNALGNTPQVQALLIRLYAAGGLSGDAFQEYHLSATRFHKEAIPLFEGLTQEEFVEVLDLFELIQKKGGAYVLKQGDAGEDIYILITGALEVLRDGRRVSGLKAGDVFGELGFFTGQRRSASVRALEESLIVRLRAEDLKTLSARYANVALALEALYTERMLTRAMEESRDNPLLDLDQDTIVESFFPRGQEIHLDSQADLHIVKHGVIEINYTEKGLSKKRFLGPGYIFRAYPGTARANTDVHILNARIDLLRRRSD